MMTPASFTVAPTLMKLKPNPITRTELHTKSPAAVQPMPRKITRSQRRMYSRSRRSPTLRLSTPSVMPAPWLRHQAPAVASRSHPALQSRSFPPSP